MERIAHRLTIEMAKAQIIDNSTDTFECYQYGLELILSSLYIFVVMLISSFFTGTTIECILFALFFCPIRAMSGGYHCRSFLSCFFFSVSIWGVYILLTKTNVFIYVIPLLALYLLCEIFIWLNAPFEHPNNPLQADEKALLKKRVRVLLIFYAIVGVLLALFDVSIKSILYYSIYIIALLMIINRFGGESNNENSLSEIDCKDQSQRY